MIPRQVRVAFHLLSHSDLSRIGRRRIVLHFPLNGPGDTDAVHLARQPQRHVDSGGYSGGRHQIAIAHVTRPGKQFTFQTESGELVEG